MNTFSSPVKLGPCTAVAVTAALLAAGAAGAYGLFGVGRPAADAANRQAHRSFEIAGRLPRPLVPGASQPLNLRLTNRRRFGLRITRLTVGVTVDARHAAAGCSSSANFRVMRLAKGAYPIRLRPRSTRTLRGLGVRRLPLVVMRNLATNQDACQGARLSFRYKGRARRWHRAGRR